MVKLLGPFAAGLALVRTHRRAYITLNVLYYGLIVGAMLIVAIYPPIQEAILRSVDRQLSAGPLTAVASAYQGGMVLQAFALTFAINLVVGALVFITLPSLVVPYAGVALGLYRAVIWGLLFSPMHPQMRTLAMLPHVLTIIVEGQGYLLAMLAAWVQGCAFVAPGHAGLSSRRAGYVEGLRQTGRLYPLIALVLLVAALYEAIEVIGMNRLTGS